MPRSVKDRGLFIEHNDKPLRHKGASWTEPTGAAVLFDDFIGDTLDTNLWVASSPQATGGTDWAINTSAGDPAAAHGGWIAGTTGTADDDNEVINGELVWKASRAGSGMLVAECVVTLPSVAGVAFQFGLTDAKNEVPFRLGASDAITSNASDAAVWIFDVDADTDAFLGLNVDTDTDGALKAGAGAPTATTATKLRIEIDSGGNCNYYFNGAFIGVDTTGVTETVALGPVADVLATAGSAAKSAEIDYILVACAR